MKRAGFTLIELSIVLIIIALLVGGYFGTQEIVQASKQARLITDMKNLAFAYNAFVTKYDAPPGDFKDGVSYFGAGKVLNGDGDGVIVYARKETTNAFLMLKYSEIYSLTTNTDINIMNNDAVNVGKIMPQCKSYGNCTMALALAGGNQTITGIKPIVNAVIVSGTINMGDTYIPPFNRGAIPPSDAEAIDQKIDDGKPLDGTLRAYRRATLCGTGRDKYTDCGGVYAHIGVTDEKSWNTKDRVSLYWVLGQN